MNTLKIHNFWGFRRLPRNNFRWDMRAWNLTLPCQRRVKLWQKFEAKETIAEAKKRSRSSPSRGKWEDAMLSVNGYPLIHQKMVLFIKSWWGHLTNELLLQKRKQRTILSFINSNQYDLYWLVGSFHEVYYHLCNTKFVLLDQFF